MATLDSSRLDEFHRLLSPRDPDLVTESIEDFLSDLGPRVRTIHQAVTDRQAEALLAAAHLLRGTAVSLGALRLAAACEMLEQAGRDRRTEGMELELQALSDEVPRVVAALREYQTSRSTPGSS